MSPQKPFLPFTNTPNLEYIDFVRCTSASGQHSQVERATTTSLVKRCRPRGRSQASPLARVSSRTYTSATTASWVRTSRPARSLKWCLGPADFSSCTGLVELGLTANIIPSFPEIIFFTSLKVLSLVNNSIAGPIPSEIGFLATLTDLSIQGELINGTLPDELGIDWMAWIVSYFRLGYLSNLSKLSLEDLQVNGSIPAAWSVLPLTKFSLFGCTRITVRVTHFWSPFYAYLMLIVRVCSRRGLSQFAAKSTYEALRSRTAQAIPSLRCTTTTSVAAEPRSESARLSGSACTLSFTLCEIETN